MVVRKRVSREETILTERREGTKTTYPRSFVVIRADLPKTEVSCNLDAIVILEGVY